MAIPTTQDLTDTPTPVSGIVVGTLYQMQFRNGNLLLVETATSTPDPYSKAAKELGRGEWVEIWRDTAAEQVYIWARGTQASAYGYVVVNEGHPNA